MMLTTLRDAAVDASDELIRFNLNIIAAELEDALAALRMAPTADNLTAVVGHWAHGKLMIDNATRDNAARQARTSTPKLEHHPCSTNVPASLVPPTTC